MNSAIPNSARRCAVEILTEILDHKRPFDEAVMRHAGLQALSERDRNFARLMVMTVLRRIGQIDDLLAKMLEKPLSGTTNDVMHALRLGVVQLVWLKTPAHAAVHAMVETAAELGHGRMKGLVNVVLKRVAGEGAAIIAAQDAAKLSVPSWIFESWRKTYGEKTARIIATPLESPPPLDITVKDNPEEWAKEWGGTVLPAGSVRLYQAGKVDALKGYEEGAWWVQDAAAALPVKLLGDIKGEVVFDLCAAPGGKTAQLALMGARVTAVDQSKRRLQILEGNMKRLKLDAELVESDILKWKPTVTPGIILLDAPCSATGTLRRHPEVVWHRKKEDIAELADLQKRMLNRVSRWLTKGGRLLYCVCSLQPEEGEEQVEKFLAAHQDFSIHSTNCHPALVAGSGKTGCRNEYGMTNNTYGYYTAIPAEFINKQGALRTLPAHFYETGGMDGFYAVVLEKIVD